jgi:hypothetical protein
MLPIAAAVTILSIAQSASAYVTLDRFEDPFPPRTITRLGQPINTVSLWVGTEVSTGLVDSVSQSSLLHVLGGERDATFTAGGTPQADQAFIGLGSLLLTTGPNLGNQLVLEYGLTTALNLDLTSPVEEYILFDVMGDQDDIGETFPVEITLTSGRGTGSEVSATHVQTIDADGLYQVPLSSFTGVDLGDVDGFTFDIDLTAPELTGVDVAFHDGFLITPEPVGLALLALTGLPLVLRRRR